MIELQGISKAYGGKPALRDVSFSVGDGRMTGFVGANGAGKTTTMRIILGVLTADSGSVTLDGSPVSASDRRRFGYMPEERGLYPKMKVLEQIVYFARLHGWSASAAKKNATDILEQLGLAERLGDAVEELSLGNQQRAQIAAALVHQPDILVLDEPFSGLDPMAVEAVQAVLSGYAARGVPVLFSSHQLDIVERLCDDLVIISDGSVRAAGARDDLRSSHRSDRFELLIEGDAGWVREMPGVNVVDFEGGFVRFEAIDDARRNAVLERAAATGTVVSFGREQVSLTQIFRELVK